MNLMAGILVVLLSVFGGYMANGGHLVVLWQPFEVVIIVGAAIGSFVIMNPFPVVVRTCKSIGRLLKGPKYKKGHYIELLCMLNAVFKLAKSKGSMALEQHIENPHDSTLFKQFPLFLEDHHAAEFLCDFLRMVVMGADNPHEIEALMDNRLDAHHEDEMEMVAAIQTMADAMPALGIVAAVLGVIHTMGSITEPPAVLGHLIGGALVILISYGFIAPMAGSLKGISNSESKYFLCMKAGLIAYMQGYAPIMAVESARTTLKTDSHVSFQEIEEAIDKTPVSV
jgi:chemotaxis protein MotA